MSLAPGTGRIARPVLARRLAGALDEGALLLVAPAGSGKTIALEEALQLRGGVTAWVRCSEADRDPGRLLGHVVDALRSAVPGAADALVDGLAGGIEQIDVARAVRALLAELDRLLVDPLTIVVDDAEQLAPTGGAVGVVARLLAADVSRLRVAVATRRPLRLRAARLRAAGRLVELGAPELAFSVQECARLLRERAAGEPSDGAVEALWAATEGWPLGVSLAARSGRTAGLAADALSEYLDEELLGALEPELRDALIDSSVARAIDPALAAALRLPDGFVEEVRRRGVPLRVLSGAGEQVAYHPLVRELLLERFERERPEARRREVHARVAGALEAAGQGPDAVEHWLVAGDPARAAGAVAVHGQALANTAPGTVGDWLERLPAEARAAPELRLLEGRLAVGAGRLEEAVAPLRAALAGFEARGDPQAAWFARIALADTCAIQEDFEAVIPLADGFEESDSPVAPMIAMSAGAALAGVGRYGEAADLLARVTAHPAGAPLAPLVAGFRGFWVDLMCGRLDAALAGAREAVAMLERADPVNRLPYMVGFVAMIQDERGEHDAAVRTMAHAERAAEEAGVGGYVGAVARRFRAGVAARAGRLAEAEAELAGAGELPRGWFPGDAEITRATIAARRGAQAAACEAAGEALGAGALSRWRGHRRTTELLAPVLVDAGRPDWGRELVEDALAARPPLASCARLLALRGWLRSLEGDDALEDVLRAWEEAGAAPEHLVRCERARLEPLLWQALERELLPPEAVIAALEAAVPGGGTLLPLTGHPRPAVRRAAAIAVAASGHPEAPARIGALERDPDPGVAAAARSSRARLDREPPPLFFTVLGGFALRRGAFSVDAQAWGGRRRAAERLVRFLLVHRDAAVPEDALFEAFWPDTGVAAARRSLQVTLSSARAVLDPPGTARSALAVADRTYRLALREHDAVDADEFERAAAAALAAGERRADALAAAAGRWTGEPLPENRHEDWAAAWRERLIDLYRRVLGELSDACSASGDVAGAVDAGRRAVALDPLDESAQRRLMAAYARSGRRGHALRQYLACRRALVDALGVEAAEETAALQRRILAGEAV